MLNITENLRSNQILYHQNILDLRTLIRQRYPHSSSDYRAKLFASAVHKLLDRYLIDFDQTIQEQIKNSLLKEAVKKGDFDLTAYQLFEASVPLHHSEECLAKNLTAWLSHHENMTFSKEELYESINHFKNKSDEAAPPVVASGATTDTVLYKTSSLPYAAAFFTAIISLSWVIFQSSLPQKDFPQPLLTVEVTTPAINNDVQLTAPSTDRDALPTQENHLTPSLQYKEINQEALAFWLNERNSMLADEPYLSCIIETAKAFNINPLLLFAITGQEQSFVPKSHPHAVAMANNPFNVYGSWQDFNTHISETSSIAARTLLNLSEGCPANEDPIQWINKKYAADPNWHIGVSQILAQLEEIADK